MTPDPRHAELDDHLADCRYCHRDTTGQLCPKGADLRRLADTARPLPA